MVVACSLYSVCCNHLGMKFIACLSCLPFPWLRDTLPGVSVALGSQPKLQNLSSAMPRGVFLLIGFPDSAPLEPTKVSNGKCSHFAMAVADRAAMGIAGAPSTRSNRRIMSVFILGTVRAAYTRCDCRLAIQNSRMSRVHPPGGRGVNGAVNVQLKQANVFYFLLFRKVQ